MKVDFAPIFELGLSEKLQLLEDLWDDIATKSANLPVLDAYNNIVEKEFLYFRSPTVLAQLDRITVNPNVCLGQPTIRGMRITVGFVLKLLASNLSVQEVLAAYPELEDEDIRQALNYAAWTV
jgi:uncharacterized protein (DUF433 family)